MRSFVDPKLDFATQGTTNCASVPTFVISWGVRGSAVVIGPKLDLAPLGAASCATIAIFVNFSGYKGQRSSLNPNWTSPPWVLPTAQPLPFSRALAGSNGGWSYADPN